MEYSVVWNLRPGKELKRLYRYIALVKKEPVSALRIYTELVEFGEGLNVFPNAAEIYRTTGKTIYRSQTYKGSFRLINRVDEKKKQVIITELFHNSQNP